MYFYKEGLELSFVDPPQEEYVIYCALNNSNKRKLTKEIPQPKRRKWRTKADVTNPSNAEKFCNYDMAKRLLEELREEKIDGDTPNHGNWILIGIPYLPMEWILREEGKENYFAAHSNNYLVFFSRNPRDVVVPFFGKLLFTPHRERALRFTERDCIRFLYILESLKRALPKRVFNVEVTSTWHSGYFGLSPVNFLLQKVFRTSSLSEVLLPSPEEDPFLRFPLPQEVDSFGEEEEGPLVEEKEEQIGQSTSPASRELSLPSHQTSVEGEDPSSSSSFSPSWPYWSLLEVEPTGYPLGLEEELRNGPSSSYPPQPWNGLELELVDLDDTSLQSFFPFHS